MTQVQIGSYIENNSTAVTSSTAKLVGAGDVFVGDLQGHGQVNADVNKARSAGVFVGVDGHKN